MKQTRHYWVPPETPFGQVRRPGRRTRELVRLCCARSSATDPIKNANGSRGVKNETALSLATISPLPRSRSQAAKENYAMLKGGLLWMLGVPLSLVIVLALVGVI